MILTAKADLQQGGGWLWDVRQGCSSFLTREQDLIYPCSRAGSDLPSTISRFAKCGFPAFPPTLKWGGGKGA